MSGSKLTAEDLLWEWCRQGWRYRGVGKKPRAEQDWNEARVRYEMGLITSKGFADFILFTSDAIRWGKDHGIPFGPGRGSTAASVVAYQTRITEINPYKYQGMLFERFIDVSRSDPPDIDVDCSDERRDDVYNYLAYKYGPGCVGHIGNFVRYRGKNSLVDIARVYNVPKWAKEVVSNLIVERSGGDARFDESLADTAEMFPNAKAIFEQFPDLWQALRLEGNVRGMSIHAAGLVVSSTPITDICSVYERNGVRVLSVDKYDAEYAGFLKLDFLGLSTMGMIARFLEMTGLTLNDLYAIPDDDKRTIDVFRRGDVIGIFQFEGRAARQVNRDVYPDNFMHLADTNALARPGPLLAGITAEYCDVRHGRRKATHLHPMVDDYTRDTYGQIVYQEQILRILKDMAGFDWFSVGQIRRVISKKLGEASFQKSYQDFVDGCQNTSGVPKETADKIWKRIVTSGTYSFNIAHAISYSMLGFWTAWMKTHYPLEFYAASLAKADDAEARYRLMKDALGHDINVVPPVLNASRRTWRPSESLGLIAGWEQIPGIGAKTAAKIDEMRWPNGSDVKGNKFKSWDDLTVIPGIGAKTVEKMATFATAHDPFGLHTTEKTMKKVRNFLRKQKQVPHPTHTGAQLADIVMQNNESNRFVKGPRVVYAGIAKSLNLQDVIENRRSRSGESEEEILKTLKRPDLLEFCSLRCYDETDEEVYVRVNRFQFPKLRRTIGDIALNHDVIVVVGNRIAGFGTPVMVDQIHIIDPD
jgi:DNA polymerase-3 subunit alpha